MFRCENTWVISLADKVRAPVQPAESFCMRIVTTFDCWKSLRTCMFYLIFYMLHDMFFIAHVMLKALLIAHFIATSWPSSLLVSVVAIVSGFFCFAPWAAYLHHIIRYFLSTQLLLVQLQLSFEVSFRSGSLVSHSLLIVLATVLTLGHFSWQITPSGLALLTSLMHLKL